MIENNAIYEINWGISYDIKVLYFQSITRSNFDSLVRRKRSKIKMEMYHHYKNGKPRDFLFYFWRFIGCDFTLHFVCDGSRQVFKGRDIKCSQGNKVRTQIKCSHLVRNWFLLLFNKNVKYDITCGGTFLNFISLKSHSYIIHQQY